MRTRSIECEITALFVPTLEIAKNFHRFKNSILRYNPRSYLGLARNAVNREIARTIRERDTNEFALFNNGITMLSDDTRIQERAGKKGRGQLYITNPQIINGGQTAYTLSSIYEAALANNADEKDLERIFGDKEVFLKVLTFPDRDRIDDASLQDLIAEVSRATNSQTAVREADRRANDRIQTELQRRIFKEFGYFYERKRGEFFDGLTSGYTDKTRVIDRQVFLRICYATAGYPAEARRTSENSLFRKDTIDLIVKDADEIPRKFFAFMCYKKLDEMRNRWKKEPNNRFGVVNYGSALEHGTLAVTFVASSLLNGEITSSNVESLADDTINKVLSMWLEFEEFAKSRSHNRSYFRRTRDPDTGSETLEADFSRYYRGDTLNKDLVVFFKLNRRD